MSNDIFKCPINVVANVYRDSPQGPGSTAVHPSPKRRTKRLTLDVRRENRWWMRDEHIKNRVWINVEQKDQRNHGPVTNERRTHTSNSSNKFYSEKIEFIPNSYDNWYYCSTPRLPFDIFLRLNLNKDESPMRFISVLQRSTSALIAKPLLGARLRLDPVLVLIMERPNSSLDSWSNNTSFNPLAQIFFAHI